MPVEFLTDEQAEAYGKFTEEPARSEPERFFFLDDEDRKLIVKRHGDHNRLGFALKMCVQESRHKLARDICHGKKGTIHQAYRESSTRPWRSPGLTETPGSCGIRTRTGNPAPTARKRCCDQDPSRRQRLSGGSSPPR
ncbi:hypothetical protein GCM10027187_72970 [Streptosporangium sandarakinum]